MERQSYSARYQDIFIVLKSGELVIGQLNILGNVKLSQFMNSAADEFISVLLDKSRSKLSESTAAFANVTKSDHILVPITNIAYMGDLTE